MPLGENKLRFGKNIYDDIFKYWGNWKSENEEDNKPYMHHEDVPFLTAKLDEQKIDTKTAKLSFEFADRIPSPWDGNLKTAKIVICYANPASDENDKEYKEEMENQLFGDAPLPTDIPAWDNWYKEKKFERLGGYKKSQEISVFNICPYASKDMSDVNWRVALCLPSVWMAQKHLREVLIPQALNGDIFLVIARAHQQWGVPYWGKENPFKNENLRIQTNRGGFIDEKIAEDFKKWKLNGNGKNPDLSQFDYRIH